MKKLRELKRRLRTTFEQSMKLREDIQQQTSTPAHQTFGKSDYRIMSEGSTEIIFKKLRIIDWVFQCRKLSLLNHNFIWAYLRRGETVSKLRRAKSKTGQK